LWQSYTNLLEEDILFQIKDYPQFDNKIRFGVSWLLKN